MLEDIVWLLARSSLLVFQNSWKHLISSLLQLIISSDEWQSKAQFNLQSLGENKTGYPAENIKFVSTDENLKKSPHFFTLQSL